MSTDTHYHQAPATEAPIPYDEDLFLRMGPMQSERRILRKDADGKAYGFGRLISRITGFKPGKGRLPQIAIKHIYAK